MERDRTTRIGEAIGTDKPVARLMRSARRHIAPHVFLSCFALGGRAAAQEAPEPDAPVLEHPAGEALPGEDAPPQAEPPAKESASDTVAYEKPSAQAPGPEDVAPTPDPAVPPARVGSKTPAKKVSPTMSAAGASTTRLARELNDVRDVDLMGLLEVDVSTATKTSESVDGAPAIITAVTAEEIQRWGYQSVGEALQHIMGFYLIDDHITPNAAVRGVTGGLGAESNVIKVMVDGRSVAFRSTGGNWLGLELIPLSAIKQIEVIRGPASALYGADAFMGVVNIITLTPSEVPFVDARVTGGSQGGNAGGSFDVTGGTWSQNWDLMLTASGEMKDRTGLEMPSQSPNPRVPEYNDPYGASKDLERKSLVFGGRGGYEDEAKGNHLFLSAYGSGVRRGGDFAQWNQLTAGIDGDGREVGTAVSLGQMRVTVDGLVQANREVALASQVTYFQGGLLPEDEIDVGSNLFYVERRMGYQGVDGNVEGRWAPTKKFNLILGTEVVYDLETVPSSSRISKDDGSVLDGDDAQTKADFFNAGAYLSSNVQAIERWLKLTGGLRYDYHNRYDGQLSGRLGATSELTPQLVLKALYGGAFKAPSPYLLLAEPLVAGDVIGNSDLDPQYINTWEGQLAYKPTRGLRVSTGVSYSLIQNKAEFIPEGINQTAQNTASQTALTWESQIDLKHGDVVGGYGSFELARSYRASEEEGYQQELVGTEMIAYPQWTARAGMYVGLPSPRRFPLELSSQAIFVGPRRAMDASILENGGTFDLDPYVLLNASLRTRNLSLVPHQQTSFAIRGKNLLAVGGPDPGTAAFEYPLAAPEIFVELRHRY